MKKYQMLLILILLTCHIYSQKIRVEFKDMVRNFTDVVYFGIDSNATIQIDSQLGEKDIQSNPFDSLDVRIIQRDSTDFYCLIPFGIREIKNGIIIYDSIYYSPSFDSKKNYRPKDSSYRHFELLLKYHNSIRFNFISENKIKLQSFVDKIIQYNLACPNSIPIEFDSVALGNDPLISFGSAASLSGTHLIFSFKANYSIPTGTNDIDEDETGVEVYPNPFNDWIAIITSGDFDYITIFDLNSKSLLNEENIAGISIFNLNTEEWPIGVYFLKLINKKKNLQIIKKLVKL